MTVPTKKDRIRPVELLALAAGFALFAGLIVLMSTRDVVLALIFFGLAFIVVLVGLAMLTLAARPTGNEQLDIDEQNSSH
jgi:peptidoglycan/LPS O-acetylase OafA/YrhL